MGYYDFQQVCLKGHQITDTYNNSPGSRKNFCPKCGEKTIYKCLNCNEPIKGDYISNVVVLPGSPAPIPTHCEACGKPFPWNENDKSFNFKEIFDKFRDTTSFEAFGIKFNGPAYMVLLLIIILIISVVSQNIKKEGENDLWQNKPLSEILSIHCNEFNIHVDSCLG